MCPVWHPAAAFAGPVDWALNAKGAGANPKIFRGDSFFPSMAQAILASDEMIQKRPELIGKLVRATLRGLAVQWAWAALFLTLALTLWKRGIRRYESFGG